jgi:hypothetical protein
MLRSMFSKKSNLILIISLIVLIGVAIWLFIFLRKDRYVPYYYPSESTEIDYSNLDIMSQEEVTKAGGFRLGIYEAVTRDEETGTPVEMRMVGIREEEPLELELMTDEEKIQFYLPYTHKVQVLQRDSEGEIMAYRIINDDEDIVTMY